MADKLVGAGADWVLSECIVADLGQIFLGNDDSGGGGRGPVEGHEVGPGLLENEAHCQWIDDLHLADAQIQFLGAGAFVTFEAELHVVSRDGVAVVKLQPVAQLELVPEAVWALRPRLRQTVAHLLPRQRTDERIVQRIEHSEGRDLWWGRRGIKPGRGDGEGPGHHGLGPGPRLAGNVLIHSEREQGYSQDRHEATCGYARHRPTPTHGSLLHVH